MIKMIKKELYFIATKHWITIVIAAFIFIITSSLNYTGDIDKPVVTVLADEFTDHFYKDLESELELNIIDSIEKGKEMVQSGRADAFVYRDNNNIIILRNEKSVRSYYVRPIIQSILSSTEIELEYVHIKESVEKFDNLYFMFALVCFALPPLLFKDDWKVLKLILLSPIKNKNIVISKMIASSLILILLTFLYLYMIDSMKISLFICIFILGLLYVSVGTLFGIFIKEKYLEYFTYPLIVIIMVLPMLSNSLSDFLNSTLQLCLSSNNIISINMMKITALIFIIFFLNIYFFKLRIRRLRK